MKRRKTWEVAVWSRLPWNAHHDRLRDEVMLQAQRLVAQAAGSKKTSNKPNVSRDNSTDIVRGAWLGSANLLARDAYRTHDPRGLAAR